MANRILEMLQATPGYSKYHPLISILKITEECPKEDHRLKLDCHRAIAKYVEAERKSVDLRSADGENLFNLRIDINPESDGAND